MGGLWVLEDPDLEAAMELEAQGGVRLRLSRYARFTRRDGGSVPGRAFQDIGGVANRARAKCAETQDEANDIAGQRTRG
jgi:hypothetical protein